MLRPTHIRYLEVHVEFLRRVSGCGFSLNTHDANFLFKELEKLKKTQINEIPRGMEITVLKLVEKIDALLYAYSKARGVEL